MDAKAMRAISYGLFVVTTKSDNIDNGCITNTVMQVTTTPNMITVAVNKANYTNELIKKSKVFNVSVISEKAKFDLFKRFGFVSGRDVNKFEGEEIKRAENGVSYIEEGCNAVISAKVVEEIDLSTHTIFVAEVTDGFTLNDVPSATYAYYFKHIKPAPQEKPKKTVFRCTICGYEEETNELPDDFTCPLCLHPKEDFEKIEA